MTTARLVAVLLIIVGGVLLAISSASVVPALVPVVAVAGLFVRWRFRISRRAGLWLSLLGGLLLIVVLVGFQGDATEDSLPMHQSALGHIGCYLLALQTAMLFVSRENAPPPEVLPGVGILVILCAALQPLEGWQESAFRALVVAYVTLAGVMFISIRRPENHRASARQVWFRRATLVTLLTVLTVASWTSAKSFDKLLDNFWSVAFRGSRSQQSGFSGSGDLNAVSSTRLELSDEVQLRVQSLTRPGYLSGQAFARFDGWGWESASGVETLYPLPNWPVPLKPANKAENLFGRSNAKGTIWREYTCQPVVSDGWVFSPLGTTHIIAPFESVDIDDQDMFLTGQIKKGQSYRALVPYPGKVSPLHSRERNQLVSVLRSHVSELDELAATVLAGCNSTSEKISAVERYFRTNYQYELEHDWEAEIEDPVMYFLRERPPAHCEFFATGAALLLRRGGVPCRYVTGYVVTEPDKIRGHWLARGRHAHAWVEAYDDENGWVIVEATPSDGVPNAGEQAWTGKQVSGEWWSEWSAGITWTLAIAAGVVVAAGIVLLVVIRRARKRKKPRYEFQQQHDPLFSALHKLLVEMDRYLRRFQLERRPSETLHDFAQRVFRQSDEEPSLLAAAQWYPIYAACRYDGDVDDNTIEVLTERLRAAQDRAAGKQK